MPIPTYKEMQIVDFKKWIDGDPHDPNDQINGDQPDYKESYISSIDGAEKIMKGMRAMVGSRLYHNDPLVMSILRA